MRDSAVDPWDIRNCSGLADPDAIALTKNVHPFAP